MPGPFDISKWKIAAPVPVPSGQRVGSLVQSPDQTLVMAVGSRINTFFDDGAGKEWETGFQAVSYDVSKTWLLAYNTLTGQPPGGYAQQDGYIHAVWTIRPLIGDRLFYRARVRFGRSTTADNGTLGAGYVKIDASVNALDWWEQQTLYTWPQVNKGVAGGQGKAVQTFGIGYASVPGSGPNGANADWLIVSVHNKSHADIVTNVIGMWRSDDFGFSWTLVRDLVGVSPWFDAAAPVAQLVRNPSGRLVAIQPASGPHVLYSDNVGVTWVDAVEPVGTAVGLIESCAGGTMIGAQAGANPRSMFSCDEGANWTAGPFYGGVAGSFALAAKRIGLQEHLVIMTTDLTQHKSWYSDDGGETVTETGAATGILVNEPVGLVRDPVTLQFLVATKLGNTAITSERPPGGFKARTTCTLGSAGIGAAKAPASCGATIVPDKCEG